MAPFRLFRSQFKYLVILFPFVLSLSKHAAKPCRYYSATVTKLSITRFVPAFSNAISSLFPSWSVTVP